MNIGSSYPGPLWSSIRIRIKTQRLPRRSLQRLLTIMVLPLKQGLRSNTTWSKILKQAKAKARIYDRPARWP